MLFRLFARLRSLPPFPLLRQSPRSQIQRPRRIEHPECIRLGQKVLIRGNGWLSPITEYAGHSYDPSIVIGDGVYIGNHACITAIDSVTIGAGSVLSEYVYVSDNEHGKERVPQPIMEQPLWSKGPVILGERVFVGFGSRILSGVTLGDWCIVAAGSVVTKSFPAGSVIGGVPAKLIRRNDA